MAVVLVRAEGFNLDATVYDTNDLSTIRGASLALLDIGGRWVPEEAVLGEVARSKAAPTVAAHERELLKEAIKRAGGTDVRIVQTGASIGTLVCETPDDADAFGAKVRRALADIQVGGRSRRPQPEPPDALAAQGHLTIAVDAVDLDEVPATAEETPPEAIDAAQARNRARQFRDFTVTPVAFVEGKRLVDPFDDVGAAEFRGPRRDRGGRREPLWLSRATRHRRDVGVDEKFNLFVRRLGERPGMLFGDGTLEFANDFQEIVADDAALDLKHNARRKLAVVHADGNGFGDVRGDVGVPKFAKEIEAHRHELLENIAGWLKQGVTASDQLEKKAKEKAVKAFVATVGDPDSEQKRMKRVLRFETILWGGDEMAFVLPAWNALAFAERLVGWTKHWDIGGHSLSFAIGVTIANVKTPVRHLRAIADRAAGLAKDAGVRDKHSISVEVFESLPPPDAGLDVFRADLYRLPRGWEDKDQQALATALACPGDEFGKLLEKIHALKGGTAKHGSFPRSQLYGALRKALEGEHSLIDPQADNAAFEHLDRYLRNAGAARDLSLGLLRLPSAAARTLADGNAGLALDCARILALWDYVDPLGDGVGGEA